MAKNPGGRPRKEMTDEDFKKIVSMMRIQCTQDEICNIFDMTAETLNTRLEERGEQSFSTLYNKHQDEGRASLRRNQWKAAEALNPTMLIWLGKQVLGQTDVSRSDVTTNGKDLTAPMVELMAHVSSKGGRFGSDD